MSKTTPIKSKPPPWIPPGRGRSQPQKSGKPVLKNKSNTSISPMVSPWKTVIDVQKEEITNPETDASSVSSHSLQEMKEEIDVHLVAILKEMKILYPHFASVKTSYLSTHRLIDSQDIQDSSIKDLFWESEVYIKKINELFEDLEYAVSVYENTLNENLKKIEYLTVLKNKEKLLLSLMEMYEKVIAIFQIVFEKQDFKEIVEQKNALAKKLKEAEEKCRTHEAVIKDLERRLSIHQSKADNLESYKTSSESAIADLQKQLSHKETHIKYLTTELKNAIETYPKSDHTEFIDMIQNLQIEAHAKKSALKKTLKFQQEKYKSLEEEHKKILQELNEKARMMYEIANQRDQLKVELTVMSNNVIQLKHQIEEMKIQNSKHQKETAEKETSYKNEILELKDSLEEKSVEAKKLIKVKAKLEETIEELETELKKSKEHMKASDSSEVLEKLKEKDDLYEEIHRLVSLLQNTKEMLENLKPSSHVVSAGGDHITDISAYGSIQNEILSTVIEAKEYILELKNLYYTGQKELPKQRDTSKSTESDRQLKKMEHLYDSALKENKALKQELEALKSAASSNSTSHKAGNYLTAKTPGDNMSRKLQLELFQKSEEIANRTHEFQQRERELENQLREYKDRLRAVESDNSKTLRLEEELREIKQELSILRRTSEVEKEKLLQRNKELQDSLDLKNAEFDTLEKYVQLVKSSYINVFDDSRMDF